CAHLDSAAHHLPAGQGHHHCAHPACQGEIHGRAVFCVDCDHHHYRPLVC
ncbi:hypothetical protein BN1723_020181, partial [Verticillium longisporum]